MHDQQWDRFKVTFKLDFFFKVIQNPVWEWHQDLSQTKRPSHPPQSLTFSMAQLALLAFLHTCLHCKRDDHVNITKLASAHQLQQLRL